MKKKSNNGHHVSALFFSHDFDLVNYTLADKPYKDFMLSILLKLEPCQFKPYFIIVNELDEYGDVTFIEKGIIDIGFEINKK